MANIDQVQLPDGSQYHIIDDTSGYATTTYVQDQISTINKNTIGLGNVDNTADINKPVSLPQQAALNGKIDDDIVAYVESDTTATKRYEVGDQFILNGVLYTATAIIAVNDTIVIGTNASLADSITTQIGNANSAISTLNTAVGTKANKADLTNLDLTGTTNTTGSTIASGTYFYLNGTLVRAKQAIDNGGDFTLNTNYEVVTAGGLNNLQSEIDNIDWYFMRSDVTTSGSYESYSLQSGRTFSEFDMLQFTFFLDNWIVGTAYLRRGDFTTATGINIIGYYDVSTPIEFSVKYESDTSFQVKHSTTQTGTKKMSVVGIKF